MTMEHPTAAAEMPEIFAQLAAEGEIPALRKTSGTYRFEIRDGGGPWFLRLDHGKPSLEGAGVTPDCTIACNAADFVEIVHGRQNVMAAVLQGRVAITGDSALALDFRRLLPVTA